MGELPGNGGQALGWLPHLHFFYLNSLLPWMKLMYFAGGATVVIAHLQIWSVTNGYLAHKYGQGFWTYLR